MSPLNWLAVTGLLIEILGLIFLFWDLAQTKLAEVEEFDSGQASDALASETRKAMAHIFQHIQTNSKMYTHLFDEQIDYSLIPGGKPSLVNALRKAQDSLYGANYPNQIQEAEERALAARKSNAARRARFLQKLRRSAMVGIALVLFGAALQLTAMFVFVGSSGSAS